MRCIHGSIRIISSRNLPNHGPETRLNGTDPESDESRVITSATSFASYLLLIANDTVPPCGALLPKHGVDVGVFGSIYFVLFILTVNGFNTKRNNSM